MLRNTLLALTALTATAATALTATVAMAQTAAVATLPGTTLAPATGLAAPAGTPAGATVGDMVPVKTPAELAKIKYQTEIVCKTTVETGSLIAKKKTCLTRKQWQYVNDENERDARKFVQDNTTKPGSN